MAGEHGLVSDVARNHRLAEALGRDQHDVAAAVEEFKAEGGLDSVAVDAFGPIPLVVGHGVEATDAAASLTTLEDALGSVLSLLVDDEHDSLGRAEAPLGGSGDQVVEVGGGVAQAEGVELLSENRLGRGGHRRSPWRARRSR